MTKIYLIRHAEAEGNYFRRIHGNYNSDITPRGRQQIAALAERFKDVHFDAVYASDLLRTQKTAGAILKYHPDLKLNIEPGLKEICMGVWEDETWGNIDHNFPKELENFGHDPANWHVAGAEEYCDLGDRIEGTIFKLAAKHPNQTIACVSHGMAIRTLIARIKGIESKNISSIAHGDNTCVALLNVDDSTIDVEYYNDNSHLKNGLSTFARQTWWKSQAKKDVSNMLLLPMDLSNPENEKIYKEAYADAWQVAHGSLKGFASVPYIQNAKKVSADDKNALMIAYMDGKFAGLIELDPHCMEKDNCGWISFIYIPKEYRGQGLAPQLIGHAVSYFRAKDRKALALHVAETNTHAIGFYNALDFKKTAEHPGALSPLYLMTKDISRRLDA